MFTGLIEEIGYLKRIIPLNGGRQLTIHSQQIREDLELGASVAVNGICLTVTNVKHPYFESVAIKETVKRSTIGFLKVGDHINLERPLRMNDRFGGHLVLGHIDGIGTIRLMKKDAMGYSIQIEIPKNLMKYIIEKGSIAVDGISLTITHVKGNLIMIAIIPHTWENTILHNRKRGDRVNIEVDFLGKYIEKLLGPYQNRFDTKKLQSLQY